MTAGHVVLALDCGTHAVRCLAFDVDTGAATECATAAARLEFSRADWVTVDPDALAADAVRVLCAGLTWARRRHRPVLALGVANMRETAVAWRRSTGRPLASGVMWMGRQSADVTQRWSAAGLDERISRCTGLGNHPFFFGSKVAWLLETDPDVRAAAQAGDLAIGTIDAWLLHRLTAGPVHATDHSNGSRTQAMGLRALAWDRDLCATLGIPVDALPQLRPSSGSFGVTDTGVCGAEVPITGVIADQQASLLGTGCERPDDVKVTLGTSGVVARQCGYASPRRPGLVTTIGWTDAAGGRCHMLEGSAFHAGYTVAWLRERWIDVDPARPLQRSRSPADRRVYVLPAFSELGAPRRPPGRGAAITGLGMDATGDDVLRAALESMAFQAFDLLAAMVRRARRSSSSTAAAARRATTSATCWRTSWAARSCARCRGS